MKLLVPIPQEELKPLWEAFIKICGSHLIAGTVDTTQYSDGKFTNGYVQCMFEGYVLGSKYGSKTGLPILGYVKSTTGEKGESITSFSTVEQDGHEPITYHPLAKIDLKL